VSAVQVESGATIWFYESTLVDDVAAEPRVQLLADCDDADCREIRKPDPVASAGPVEAASRESRPPAIPPTRVRPSSPNSSEAWSRTSWSASRADVRETRRRGCPSPAFALRLRLICARRDGGSPSGAMWKLSTRIG